MFAILTWVFRLQFTYKGQTATLQSQSDIAAWIAERKKRYPTKARIKEAAEQKRQLQDAQRAANEARREKQEKRKAEIKDRQKLDDLNEAAQKAKLKAEKLRRQLKKEEKRIARAEAEAAKAKNEATAVTSSKVTSNQGTESKKRKREGSVVSTASGIANGRNEVKVESMDSKIAGDSLVQDEVVKSGTPDQTPDQTSATAEPSTLATEALVDPVQPTDAPSATIPDLPLSEETHAPVPEVGNKSTLPEGSHKSANTDEDDSMSMSNSSSDTLSDDDNDTSSIGSSSDGNDNDNDDDDDDDAEAPDEAPSPSNGPLRVPPPKREKPKTMICKAFLQKGHCKRGDACKYRHQLPKRGNKSAANVKEREGKEGNGNEGGKRIGLYQRVW